MKSFLQTIQEDTPKSKLDKLTHMVKYPKKHLKTLSKPFPAFEHINLEDWQSFPPPSNSSLQTANEIKYLISLYNFIAKQEEDIVMHDTSVMKAFKLYADEYGLEINFDRINDLRKQTEPVILSLKRHYNRPRPIAVAKELGLPLETFPLKTAGSPSYRNLDSCRYC